MDNKDNKDKLAVPNTSTAWYDYVSRSKQKTETPTRAETIDSDTLLDTSRMKVYPVAKTSWTQRVLSWFRRD